MSIIQAVIGAIVSGGGAPTATYTLTPAYNNVNEGDSVVFFVGGTNIPDGTYYWTIADGSWALADFSTINGSVYVTNSYAVFSITPTADVTTEGSETFNVTLRSVSIMGTILATSSSITINDTSIGPSPFSANLSSDDSILQGQNGWWSYVHNGGGAWLAASAFSVSAPTYNTITYPDTVTTGHTYDFTAGQYLISPALVLAGAWITTPISIDFWFYPTANGVQLLTELGQPQLSADYHTTLLEIDSSSYVKARFWQTGGGLAQVITSSNTVNLNQWNHIYFAEDINGAHTFALNNVATTGLPTYTRAIPTPNIHYAIGGSDTTNMGNTGGFQGKIGILDIRDHVAGSTYTEGYSSKFFAPTYALYRSATDVNEGSSIQISIGGTNVPPGTYYWTIETGASEFATTSGSFEVAIIDGILTGSATLTPTEDMTTEGAETCTVALRSGSVTGTILATSDSFTINDTSLAPVPPFSLQFVNSENDYLEVAQPSYTVLGSSAGHAWAGTISSGKIFKGSYPEPQVGWILIGNSFAGPYQVTLTGVTDGGATWDLTWAPQVADNLYMDENYSLYDPALAASNLGTTWTMEFWLKANAKSETAGGGIWGLLNQVGWSTTNAIVVALSDNKLVFLSVANSANNDVRYVEPTPGVWTHVAIANDAGTQKVFYNGVEQTRVSGNVGTASYTNSTDPVRIGRLGPANGGTLDGKMALVRISNTAKYSTAFTPITTYGVEADTKLFLGTDTPLVDSMSHAVTNNGTTLSNDVPGAFAPQSLAFNGSTNYLDVVSGLSDFNLSTTWTIEFWSKATTSSTGNLFTVMSQNADANSIDIFYQNGDLVVNNGRTIYTEPTPGVWTHVALVCTSTELNVYYNGVNVHNGGAYSVVDATNSLNIGKRGQIPYQYFNGRLALIRISNNTQYATAFTPTVTYGVEFDTVLFLGKAVPLIDAKGHITSNTGVTQSASFPVIYTVRQWLGSYGPGSGNSSLYVRLSDYPDAGSIPVGAKTAIGTVSITYVSTYSGTPAQYLQLAPSQSMGSGDYFTFIWSS